MTSNPTPAAIVGPESLAPLVVLVDDVRIFRDGRPALLAQTADAAIDLLESLQDRRIDELWLDYDLFNATVEPLVTHMVDRANAGDPVDVATVIVHSSRTLESVQMIRRLRSAGYTMTRSYAADIWARNPATVCARSRE